MTDEIKQNLEGGVADWNGDTTLLDLLHRINVREKIVERPTEPEKESEDD